MRIRIRIAPLHSSATAPSHPVSAALRLSVSIHLTSFLLHNAGISKQQSGFAPNKSVSQIEAHKFRDLSTVSLFAEFAKSDGAGIVGPIFSLSADLLHFNNERQ